MTLLISLSIVECTVHIDEILKYFLLMLDVYLLRKYLNTLEKLDVYHCTKTNLLIPMLYN